MMKHATIAITCILSAATLTAQLTPEQMREDLVQLRTALERYHPGLHRYTSPEEFNRVVDAAYIAADEPMDAGAFFRVVASVVAAVRCGHTRVRPDGSALRELMTGGRQLPIEVRFVGDRTFVTGWRDGASELPTGSELLTINGTSMATLREQLLSLLWGDGWIPTGRLRELQGLFPLYYAILVDASAASFDLELRPPGAEPLETTVAAARFRPPSRSPGGQPLALEIREDGVAVMTIRTFSSAAIPGYRGFLASSIEELEDKGIDKLVLDLRGNGGGTDEYGALLVSYLCPRPFGYFARIEVTADYEGEGDVRTDAEGRRFVTAHSGLQQQQPAESVFEGQLVVLIDGGTFSTAADVATVLHHQRLGVFVGEETGGGYDGNTSGTSRAESLAHSQIRVDIPLWMYTTANEGHRFSGRGVIPDHAVEPMIEDILGGRDPVLAKALEVLESR